MYAKVDHVTQMRKTISIGNKVSFKQMGAKKKTVSWEALIGTMWNNDMLFFSQKLQKQLLLDFKAIATIFRS